MTGSPGWRSSTTPPRCVSPSVSRAYPGWALINRSFFNEFTLRLPCPAAPVVEKLAKQDVLGGIPVSRLYPDRPELADLLMVAATETVTDEDIDRFEQVLREAVS